MSEQLRGIDKFYSIMIEFFANYSLQIIGAIIIFTTGVFLSKYIYKFTLKILLKYNLDETLSGFIANFFKIIVILMMGILALGKLGISIAPFIAAIGAISLTAGLALQGSVSNFAAGLVLVATKPFKIGDTITVKNNYGEVDEIKLAYTVLVNENEEKITIPNKYMIGDVLINSFKYRIVEGSINISYDSNIADCIKIIKNILQNSNNVSNENESIVGIHAFRDSGIEINYRYWVPTKSFFKIQYEINLLLLKALNEAKITIPFPQLEVKILENSIK
ncbi:mechanosensitive ion channel family protein [Sulfurimonas sp.]|uniref:mechanosensitive ion channel family protein n=1 Tax=Sulfurimonas sp. TaxID=2022749 RepID=UPI0025F6919A|nr:mechanosensitive ion channel family protein [Sulfurimonas sp.]MDD5157279.1 mechanosensitive ion channel family protein [Sulfurimonas sp.]